MGIVLLSRYRVSLKLKIVHYYIFPFLFFSIHGGSSVRTYLDCHWITTQVLHKHALNVPEDTDLIIGYMFQVRNYYMPILMKIYSLTFAC